MLTIPEETAALFLFLSVKAGVSKSLKCIFLLPSLFSLYFEQNHYISKINTRVETEARTCRESQVRGSLWYTRVHLHSC